MINSMGYIPLTSGKIDHLDWIELLWNVMVLKSSDCSGWLKALWMLWRGQDRFRNVSRRFKNREITWVKCHQDRASIVWCIPRHCCAPEPPIKLFFLFLVLATYTLHYTTCRKISTISIHITVLLAMAIGLGFARWTIPSPKLLITTAEFCCQDYLFIPISILRTL